MPLRPTLLIATDENTFDISPWSNEGYTVHLLTKANRRTIEDATDDLESCDRYAILAFGEAATEALSFATFPSRQLQAVSAYYPTAIPATDFRPNVHVLLHLCAESPFSVPRSQTVRVRLYEAAPGFAGRTRPTYERISESLSFSRTLSLLRATIGPPMVDLEGIWDEHMLYEFGERDVRKTLGTMVPNPYVNHIPTLTGGVGYDNLYRFYKDYFIPKNPPSMKMTLVSRTVGSDRIVDEMVAKFRHTCEIPFMLPGVAPTNKEVEVALVSVVCIRGGKLYHEHIYWDQATVLVQLGLLEKGSLPVAGVESARKVLDERSEPSNVLIKDW